MKLMFWSFYADKNNLNGFAMNTLREKFNIDADFYTTTGEAYKEKLQLMLASGEVPDWWKMNWWEDYDKFVDQGVGAEIPEELLNDYAPHYVAWLKKNAGEGDPFRYVRRNGKIYSMQDMWTLGSKYKVLGFREDWLNKVGITKAPETLDEMEAALTKFRNDDPDGNGKKDTYGITGTAENVNSIFSSVFGAFGVYPGAFVEENGKVVRGEISPKAKDALTLLNSWYKKELIDPEFIVNKSSNVDDKVVSQKVGAVENAWWAFIPKDAFYEGLYYEKIRETNPDAKWSVIGGPKGPDGAFGITQDNPFNAPGIQFGKQLEKDQPKLIKYLQVFDDTISNIDTWEKTNYGEKGKTFQVTADGSYEFLAPYDKEDEQIKFGVGPYYSIPRSFNDYDMQAPFMTKKALLPIRQEAESKGTGKYDILQPLQKPVYNEFVEPLKQLTIQNFIDFITGKRPIGEFDKFVEEWNAAGGKQVMEEAQQKFDEMK